MYFLFVYSDEQNRYCDSPVEVRLAEGNNVTMGRIEVRYKGLIFDLIATEKFERVLPDPLKRG